jgi:hypothetical protein
LNFECNGEILLLVAFNFCKSYLHQMATCVKCLEFWAMDDTCKIELRPLFKRVLSTRVHCWTQFGCWTFGSLSHFLSILGDPKNHGYINESFMEPLWTLEAKNHKAGCVHLVEKLPLWPPEAKEQWRTTKHV